VALSPFKLRPKPGEHWFLLGKTGSGKSVCDRVLLRPWVRAGWPILLIDVGRKEVDEANGGTYARTPQESSLEHPWRIKEWHEGVPVQIYLPELPASRDENLAILLDKVQERGYVVVVICDTHGMMTANSAPPEYLALLANGRAKHNTVHTLSQRPFQVPDMAMSQSTHFLIFRQLGSRNRKRMVDFTDDPSVGYPLKKFEFRYWNEELERAVKFAPLSRQDVQGANTQDSHGGGAGSREGSPSVEAPTSEETGTSRWDRGASS
jgi:hypothetical protein